MEICAPPLVGSKHSRRTSGVPLARGTTGRRCARKLGDTHRTVRNHRLPISTDVRHQNYILIGLLITCVSSILSIHYSVKLLQLWTDYTPGILWIGYASVKVNNYPDKRLSKPLHELTQGELNHETPTCN